MLIIKEGLKTNTQQAKSACLTFLKPTITAYKNNLAKLFELIDCSIVFSNAYYRPLTRLLCQAIYYEIEDEMDILDCFETVIDKLDP